MATQKLIMTFLIAAIAATLPTHGDAASAHIHTLNKLQKDNRIERLQDAVFNPPGTNHHSSPEERQQFEHEAILGSVKEADQFDKMSPEESKRRLIILLTKMDLNNDKYIERNELKAWILRSFSMLTAEEVKERLEDSDLNGDGRVSWPEILRDTYGSDPNSLTIENERADQEEKATFEAADFNNDGYLDGEEFKAYTHPEEIPQMFPFLLEQILKERDANKDGYINFQEFITNEDIPKNLLLIEKQRFDQWHDKNSDGHLDAKEIVDWLAPDNDEIASDEADHLFAASDEDQDNRLSFDEILDHHNIFVGSEVTDYGNYLTGIDRFLDEF